MGKKSTKKIEFYVGWHQVNNGESGTKHFDRCMISVNRLLSRRSNFKIRSWILDSGAFSRIISGKGHLPVKKYAKIALRWSSCGNLKAVVAQDYLCDRAVLNKTGLTIKDHQRLSILRYDRLFKELSAKKIYVMPVLQGMEPKDYVSHLTQYSDRLEKNAWVGVGSIAKRKSSNEIAEILTAVKSCREDLNLHGFGVKLRALKSSQVRELLFSTDSQAHSFGQSKQRKFQNANDPLSAIRYYDELVRQFC